MITKENDFIEVSYVGRIKESNQIFDLTDEELAKKENLFNKDANYSPKIICLGHHQLLEGLDKQLIGKETGKTYTIELNPESAFGKKDSNLIKTINTRVLHEQKINPFPGLQINASGMIGTIVTVSSGRTIIDFNHPLAGRNLIYEIKINRIVEDEKEKLNGLIENLIGLKKEEYEMKFENKKAEIKVKNHKIPESIKNEFIKKTKELIPGIEISFM